MKAARRDQHRADAATGPCLPGPRGDERPEIPSWALPGRATLCQSTGNDGNVAAGSRKFPKMTLCVATNGLGVVPYVDEIADLKVSHVTITIKRRIRDRRGDLRLGARRQTSVAWRGSGDASDCATNPSPLPPQVHGIVVRSTPSSFPASTTTTYRTSPAKSATWARTL